MSDSKDYNGWSNRETWLVSLWLTNDEHLYILLKEALSLNMADFEQADWLEDRLRDILDDQLSDASLWSDLLSTAFYRIDWVEVIDNNQE